MSVPSDHNKQSAVPVSQSHEEPNWTTHVSDIRTVKVSNVALTVAEVDMREFFSFSGEIQYVEKRRESEKTQLFYVTFKESQGADTALLLSEANISGLLVTISPVEDYQLPPEAVLANVEKRPPDTDSAVQKAEDVVTTMLAKGFILGKDALDKAKAFDEQHHLTSNASATVTSLDCKMGLSQKFSKGTAMVNEKLKEVDERFQVSEKTKSAYAVAEQKASEAGTAIMSNRYILTGATWATSAYNSVTKKAGDVSTRTMEKVEKAQEEKNHIIQKDSKEIINDLEESNP